MLLEKIMVALRWNFSEDETKSIYEAQAQDAIDEAKAEMANLGISVASVDDESDPEITRAIKNYALSVYAEDPGDREYYVSAFQNQVDRLRKSVKYAK